MKIGIDCRFFSPHFTWIGRYTYELVSYLEKNDSENEYVLFLNEPHYSEYTPTNPRFKKILVNAKHYSIQEQTIFLYKILKEKLDLMHFTHFNAPLFYLKPSVVTIHDLTVSFYPGKKMTRFYHRLAYNLVIKSIAKRSKQIIAVSKNTKKDIVDILNIEDSKIDVIYNWINPWDFEKIEDEKEINNMKLNYNIKNPYLLYTWVWREHKNLSRLINAYAEVVKEWVNVDLVIAWKEDLAYSEVRNAIIQNNLQNRVHLVWFQQWRDLALFYSWALAYVFPSLYEWFGLPILEAMASKLPVICSNNSSLPEVAWEWNVVYFNPTSIDSIKEAIIKISTDEQLRNDLVTKWQERVKEFSWQKMWKETLDLYKKQIN